MLDTVWIDEILGAVALCALVCSIGLRAFRRREDSLFALAFAVATAITYMARNW